MKNGFIKSQAYIGKCPTAVTTFIFILKEVSGMITGDFRHKIYRLWEMFRMGHTANPPFKDRLDTDTVLQDILKTKKTKLLFPFLFLRINKGARYAPIVPEGALCRSAKAHTPAGKEARCTRKDQLVPKCKIIGSGYDLFVNEYKKMPYVPAGHPSMKETMTKMNRIGKKIAAELAKPEEMRNE